METTFLFPHRFKFIGWLIFIPSALIGLYVTITGTEWAFLQRTVFALIGDDLGRSTGVFTLVHANLTYTLITALFIIGAMLVAFSKEAIEDEIVAQQRLSAFQWAVFANYALLLILVLGVYGITFLMALQYNMLLMIVLFIGRFQYLLYRNTKLYSDEK